MSDKSIIRRKWKLIINIATIVALLALIYVIRSQLKATILDFTHINGWLVLLIIPVEALNYHVQAKLYQSLFGLVGDKVKYKNLLKASLELNMVNHLFPSGGAAGISYFGMRVSDGRGISGAKATLIQLMKLVLIITSFEVLLIFGLLCLAVVGRVNELTILVGGALSTLLVVATFAFVYVVGSRSRINTFFGALTKAINWLIHKILRKQPETINISKARAVFDDFHANYQLIVGRWRQLKPAFWYALLSNITEIMAVYVFYIAFGKYVNIGAVILAYGVANFAGLISVLPGGVGIYEALMTAVLVSAGIPARISLPVTIMYRVVNTVIQLPPGYYFYHKNLNNFKEPMLDV